MVAVAYKKKEANLMVATCRISVSESEEIDRIGADRFRSRAECLQYLIRKGLEAEKKALEARESNSNA